jgi:hypothetical protein
VRLHGGRFLKITGDLFSVLNRIPKIVGHGWLID